MLCIFYPELPRFLPTQRDVGSSTPLKTKIPDLLITYATWTELFEETRVFLLIDVYQKNDKVVRLITPAGEGKSEKVL